MPINAILLLMAVALLWGTSAQNCEIDSESGACGLGGAWWRNLEEPTTDIDRYYMHSAIMVDNEWLNILWTCEQWSMWKT